MKHLYLDDYAEINSKISYLMFLLDYLLACEVSTVRTLALNSLALEHNLADCLVNCLVVGSKQFLKDNQFSSKCTADCKNHKN